MSKTDLIKKLETERTSRVITYATSDRAPFATKIANDIIPLLGNQLDAIGKVKKSVFPLHQRWRHACTDSYC